MPESSKCERNAEQHADVQLVKWRLASADMGMHTKRFPLCCKHVYHNYKGVTYLHC
jgi:hypothetical protein